MAFRRVAPSRQSAGEDAAALLRRSWDVIARGSRPGLYSGGARAQAVEWGWRRVQDAARRHDPEEMDLVRGSQALAAAPLRQLESAARHEAVWRLANAPAAPGPGTSAEWGTARRLPPPTSALVPSATWGAGALSRDDETPWHSRVAAAAAGRRGAAFGGAAPWHQDAPATGRPGFHVS